MFIYLINYTKEYVVQRTNTMKKLSFFIMLLCAVTCYGEIVSEVSFNPSRMGDYNYLKVADKATLVGGLETDYLNIRSNGTVTLKNSASSSATFQVNNQIIGDPDENQTVEISFPNAAFEVGSAVYAVGGVGDFDSGVITDRILGGEENGSNKKLKQKAGTLTGGSVTIEGGSGDLYDGESINGFWLEGNLIPTPTSLKNKNCEMEWDERFPAGSSTSVKLLALKDCTVGGSGGSGGSTPSTGSDTISCVKLVTESQTFMYSNQMDYNYTQCVNAYKTWSTYTVPESFLQPGVLIPNRFPSWRQKWTANCPTPAQYGGSSVTGTITYLVGEQVASCPKSQIINPYSGNNEY